MNQQKEGNLTLLDNERIINTTNRKDSTDFNSTGINSMGRSRQTFYKKK
jgi:hypothetical protein